MQYTNNWKTNTANSQRVLKDLGYTFNKTDIWVCKEAGKVVDSSKSLGDLVNKVVKSIGGI